MALLRDMHSGHEHELVSRHIVGRAPACHLRIDSRRVSGLHAELLWGGQGWSVQDLGSRNGTRVNGERLAAGERRALSLGAKLTFGSSEASFELVDDNRPRLQARSNAGQHRVATDELLCLPEDEDPEVVIYPDRLGRWLVDGHAGSRELDESEPVLAGGAWWRVFPPLDPRSTIEAELSDVGPIEMRLYLSRDGEHVSASVRCGGRTQELESRAHTPLLLELARVRLSDIELGNLPEAEQGWIHRDDLHRRLGIGQRLLNLWVFRARQQLARARIPGATDLIQRRSDAQQLRLATGALELITA